jgi:ech hydrogenase subunit E
MKRTVIPMGPQHPVLPEPIVLDLILEDERVVDAIPTIGYIHRGLEMMVERVEYTEMGFVVERICGICSFMHGMGYCVSLESIMNIEVPERARWLRLIWAEISRIQSHLLWLGLGADAFGFENLFMHCWRMREEILDIFEKTTGGRIIHSVNRIGGVKRDISDTELARSWSEAAGSGPGLQEDRAVSSATTPRSLTGSAASACCPRRTRSPTAAVGPMARASGIATDTRLGGANLYDQIEFEPDHRDRRRLPGPRGRPHARDRSVDRHHPPGHRQDAQGRGPGRSRQAPRQPRRRGLHPPRAAPRRGPLLRQGQRHEVPGAVPGPDARPSPTSRR